MKKTAVSADAKRQAKINALRDQIAECNARIEANEARALRAESLDECEEFMREAARYADLMNRKEERLMALEQE